MVSVSDPATTKFKLLLHTLHSYAEANPRFRIVNAIYDTTSFNLFLLRVARSDCSSSRPDFGDDNGMVSTTPPSGICDRSSCVVGISGPLEAPAGSSHAVV